MTSEEKHGISKPSDHQCANIDNFIKIADGIKVDIASALRCDTVEDMRKEVENADWNAGDIEGFFEELRQALEETRQWGQEWKNKAQESE